MPEPIVDEIAVPHELPYETPFDRVVRGVRALARREQPGDALVAQGARHVRAGLIASGIALGGFLVGAFMIGRGWPPMAASVVTTFAVTGAGVLASSRVARGIAWLQALSFAAGGVRFFLHLHRDSAFFAADLVVGTSMLLFAGGVGLATRTPAARAWHRAQLAARAVRRKVRSLAQWRARA